MNAGLKLQLLFLCYCDRFNYSAFFFNPNRCISNSFSLIQIVEYIHVSQNPYKNMEPVIVRILCNQPCITGSPYTLLIDRLEPSFLFHSVLDIPFLYLPATLMSEVTQFASILGVVALCYNIVLQSIPYLDIAFSHHVYFQQPVNLEHTRHHV